MAREFTWKERYNIGVDEIDAAHKRLFSTMRRLIDLNKDLDKNKQACCEAIRFLNSSIIKHFLLEEQYMQLTGYGGYPEHKYQHDYFRNTTLPLLEDELGSSGYSQEAVQHFLGVCIGWMAGHIVVEDRAITKKDIKEADDRDKDSPETILESTILTITGRILGQAEVEDPGYQGSPLDAGIYYCLTYLTEQGAKAKVYLGIEEYLILHTFEHILGKQLQRIDRMLLYAAMQLAQQSVKLAAMEKEYMEMYRLERDDLLTYQQFLRDLMEEHPRFSRLYNTEHGRFSFSLCLSAGLANN